MAEILIVEDNAANMRLARLLLTSAGHSVICAADAETGLKLARELQPALILMDIQLPGMDGLKATSLLKSDALTAAIPVIGITLCRRCVAHHGNAGVAGGQPSSAARSRCRSAAETPASRR